MRHAMTRLLAERILGVPWTLLMALGLGIAVIYLVMDTSTGATGLRWWILRWFHSLCWLLLAAAALAKAQISPLPREWAGGLGVAGGLVYAVFIVTTMLGRS